jgi:hypothetical protein
MKENPEKYSLLGCNTVYFGEIPKFRRNIWTPRSRGNVFGIATSYWLDDRGVGIRVPVGSRIFSSPRHLGRLWGRPSLLSSAYRDLFPGGKLTGTWSWLLISN